VLNAFQRINWEETYFKEAQTRNAEAKSLSQMRQLAVEAAQASVSKLNEAATSGPRRLPPLQQDELADEALGLVTSLSEAGCVSMHTTTTAAATATTTTTAAAAAAAISTTTSAAAATHTHTHAHTHAHTHTHRQTDTHTHTHRQIFT
jgi:hypothetical protein